MQIKGLSHKTSLSHESLPTLVLPEGFEYTVAEIGSASTTTTGPVEIALTDTYGQFANLHLNSHGVVRA